MGSNCIHMNAAASSTSQRPKGFACSPTRHRLDPRATARAYGGSRASAEATPPTTLVQNATCVLAGAACCMVMAGPSMALDWNPETTARQGSSYTPAVMAAAPQISELFGSQAQDSFNDPVDPFTLYGTVFRKYLIERLDGEKIVSRKKGITTVVCTSALPAALETPEVQFLPLGEKARLAGNAQCRKAETSELTEGCAATCPTSCAAGIDNYMAGYTKESGYRLDEKAYKRLLASCTRRCNQECSKGGTNYDYAVNFRRY